MKTKSSTPWCNLFSTASKYNICVKQSRYRNLLLAGSGVGFSLLLAVYLTYSYHLILIITVVTATLISLFMAKNHEPKLVSYQIELNENGICSFEYTHENMLNKTLASREQFQLLPSSRFSFFGCWLHMSPLPTSHSPELLISSVTKSDKKEWLFIYRDSLTSQGFTQLSHVIRAVVKPKTP